ncbi:unnamed protein product [Schistocephalus solidus]|uniref:Uncharacterized protein n=1 Tax=Schistocephalus solidus TaxID=70667 RepID=A0A183THK4_SCHSO|nr:unnamed protein product [Schistocephalus solidus]
MAPEHEGLERTMGQMARVPTGIQLHMSIPPQIQPRPCQYFIQAPPEPPLPECSTDAPDIAALTSKSARKVNPPPWWHPSTPPYLDLRNAKARNDCSSS